VGIDTETVTYAADGQQMNGYLAYDSSIDGQRPGVIVIHEWWGLNDYIKGRARMLAELGYTALALDMYGDGQTAADPDGAGALMNAVLGNMASGTARLEAGYRTLADQPTVDSAHLAAIGYCFGGAMALHAARIGMDLEAVASFHGALGSFHQPDPGQVKARVLVCHGAADTLVPQADVTAFKAEMDAAGADYRFLALDDALHGFTNPAATANGEKYGLPLAYDQAADDASWAAMRELFRDTLDR
jgi:dienelactone hydrolase